MPDLKLSKKQNAVVFALQNGGQLLTDSRSSYVGLFYNGMTVYFSGVIFWNLVKKELLSQELSRPFDYKLTLTGKEVSAKKCDPVSVLHT